MKRAAVFALPLVIACAAFAIHCASHNTAPGIYTHEARNLATLASMGISVRSIAITASPTPGAAGAASPAVSPTKNPNPASAKPSPANTPAADSTPGADINMKGRQGAVSITIDTSVVVPAAKPAPANSPVAAKPAATAIPQEKKRNIATRILEDLRLIDSATDQYAIETNRVTGMNPSLSDLKNYLRSGTTLYDTGKDPLGNAYGPFTVDSIPRVSDAAFNALSDIADESFWSPYH